MVSSPPSSLIAEQARLDEEKKKAREARFNVQTVPAAKRHAEGLDAAEPVRSFARAVHSAHNDTHTQAEKKTKA